MMMMSRCSLNLRRLAATSVLLAAVALPGALIAPRVFGRVVYNTIDTVATISADGNKIIVTGPLQCDLEQFVDLRVTVTQRSTGALAEGKLHFEGNLDIQTWTVDAAVKGPRNFEEGEATAVALAVSKVNGQADDAHQWLVDIDLVAEE